jgi:hypothetical protein
MLNKSVCVEFVETHLFKSITCKLLRQAQPERRDLFSVALMLIMTMAEPLLLVFYSILLLAAIL